MGLRPTQGEEKRLGPATTLYRTVALSFVIPSEAEGSAVPRTSLGNVFRQSVAEICGFSFLNTQSSTGVPATRENSRSPTPAATAP
jgi:hypothetical protein